MHPLILEKDSATSSLELAKLLPYVQQHFLKPNAALYYLDFTVSAVAGNVFLLLAAMAGEGALQWFYVFAAALALFRATIFIHEAYHLSKSIPGFGRYYNLLHGFLHKMPLYSYTPHRYHHLPATYGTAHDPEYEPLGDKSAFYNLIGAPLLLMTALPLFMVVRWGILPLALPFIGEHGRQRVYAYASTLAMNMRYRRPAPSEAEKREWYTQDAGCAIYTLVYAGLIAAGILPARILAVWYVTFYIVSVLNYYRVLISHRYLTGLDATSHKQQIIDSVTFPLTPQNAWLYPVGLGYHALHHMFPQIPYHNIGKAHRWLMQVLPENHPYRLTVVNGYFRAIGQLLARKF